MGKTENAIQEKQKINHTEEFFDFDELENRLEAGLEEQIEDLEFLKKDREMIGNPESLGNTVMNVVWEQFINQIGAMAGEEFIKENGGLPFDLRKDAKVINEDSEENQTKGDSAMGDCIDSESDGKNQTKKFESFDETKSRQKEGETDGEYGRVKQEGETGEEYRRVKWEGETGEEYRTAKQEGGIGEEYRRAKQEEETGEEYGKARQEGEEWEIETGKHSRKEEVFQLGGKALKAAIMSLFAELVRDIIGKLIAWLKEKEKNLESFIGKIKEAIHTFVGNLKQNLLTAADTVKDTVIAAISNPIIDAIEKAWAFLKQGAKSVKEAVDYIRSPENKNKPFGILMLEVGKIVVAGLTAVGTMALGGIIEKGLMTIPVFAIEIPFLGSLAGILGALLSTLVAGIIGAIAINLIDKAVAKKQKEQATLREIDRRNEILRLQDERIAVSKKRYETTKKDVKETIEDRHQKAAEVIREAADNIFNTERDRSNEKLSQMNSLLDTL